MSFLTATEKTNSVWGRLLLTVMFASYILATIKHQSPFPIATGFIFLLGIAIFYYIPLRLIYWLFKGDGEIKNNFLLWLPFPILTLVGVFLVFAPDI